MADFRRGSFFGSADLSDGLIVEFEDDVDASRTGGKPSRLSSPSLLGRFVTGGLLRVGLCCLIRGVFPEVVATVAGEYEEAELGVGT